DEKRWISWPELNRGRLAEFQGFLRVFPRVCERSYLASMREPFPFTTIDSWWPPTFRDEAAKHPGTFLELPEDSPLHLPQSSFRTRRSLIAKRAARWLTRQTSSRSSSCPCLVLDSNP